MWLKKHWILVTILAAVVVLITGIVGGVAYAQTPSPQTSDSSGKTLLARVAVILGKDQATVEKAFAQAQKEMQDEAETAHLNKLVDEGKITQDQATNYKTWLESKPDVPAGLGLEGGMRFPGGPGGKFGPRAGLPLAPPAASNESN